MNERNAKVRDLLVEGGISRDKEGLERLRKDRELGGKVLFEILNRYRIDRAPNARPSTCLPLRAIYQDQHVLEALFERNPELAEEIYECFITTLEESEVPIFDDIGRFGTYSQLLAIYLIWD